MQMHGSLYRSSLQCVISTLRTEGPQALYRSFPTQLLMNIPFQSVHFVMYEITQEKLNPTRTYSPASHVLSGAAAGAGAAFITNPLDVCRTLLNTQELNNGTQKKRVVVGLFDALSIVFRTDGIRTFFRGVTARVMYQMPATAISWSCYELFKHLLYPPNSRKAVNTEVSSGHPRELSFPTKTVCAAPSCPGTVMTSTVVNCKDS